ncbi:MAG TPA: methyltransferase domain-containing protein [Candidatus Limnocylindrales bacterium]|nr:methyltransferase domain-containing protein [Candidatus Limnocylindrales bacterium]
MTDSDRAVAPDGSPVEVYRRLPPNGEAEIVHGAVAAGATILELGSGAGRVSRGLVALGHPVVAVDESASMLADLAAVDGVEAVEARIEELALGRRFPVVLLGSHLLNALEPQRSEILDAAVRDAAPGAALPIEVYPPRMAWRPGERTRSGDVDLVLERAAVDGGRVTATVAYSVDGRVWRQSFDADLLDEAGLRAVLRSAGLAFERWLDEPRGWLLARAPG